MNKCEECVHSRPIISENGYHSVCCLSSKAMVDCLMDKKSQFITFKRDENGNIKIKTNS